MPITGQALPIITTVTVPAENSTQGSSGEMERSGGRFFDRVWTAWRLGPMLLASPPWPGGPEVLERIMDIFQSSDTLAGRTAGRAAALVRNWWLIGLRGGFAILFGLLALLLPGPTLDVLLLLFGAYLIVDGCSAIASGLRAAARHEQWMLLILEGVIDLVLASIVLAAPAATAPAFVYLAAGWAIVTGAVLAAAATGLTAGYGRWWMGLAGVCSVIWGVLLLAWPAVGALIMTLWLGGYALAFGTALVALALALRGIRQDGPAEPSRHGPG